MKIITFRPLRRIKKTGKVTVASYMQWRKVKTADYNNFALIINEEYKTMPPDEYVYDHNGEILFWKDVDINSIPVLPPYKLQGEDFRYPRQWISINPSSCDNKIYISYSVRGLDCDGIPVFSHRPQSYVATHFDDLTDFEPLTVSMVTKWFGWFLYQLENSRLQTL